MLKTIFKIFIFTLFFTVVIYFINYNFFLDYNEKIEKNIAEEKYIETSIVEHNLSESKKILNKEEKKIIKNYYKKILFYKINYFPYNFGNKVLFFKKDINVVLNNKIFKQKIRNLIIDIYKDKIDRRGNTKQFHIRLFGLNKAQENEYLSVFIHELGHFIDIYFFEKKVFFDISEKFYEISWEQTKVKKKNQKITDFVSGYAMTNKYEDFAESFTFYILHNDEFLKRAKKSEILKKKYNFFVDYLFKNKEFFATDFHIKKYKKYYWDTTKIIYEKEKFFSYLKNLN